VAENVPCLSKASPANQSRSAFMPDYLSHDHLIGAGNSKALLSISPSARLSANALLLPLTARTLGLASLMLRE
jgi:hypothetical protein